MYNVWKEYSSSLVLHFYNIVRLTMGSLEFTF